MFVLQASFQDFHSLKDLPNQIRAHILKTLHSYTVFEFVTNASDQNDLRLSCKVKACEYSADDPLAMGACIDDSVCSPGRRGRKRRSVGDSERYTTVSQRIRVVNPES